MFLVVSCCLVVVNPDLCPKSSSVLVGRISHMQPWKTAMSIVIILGKLKNRIHIYPHSFSSLLYVAFKILYDLPIYNILWQISTWVGFDSWFIKRFRNAGLPGFNPLRRGLNTQCPEAAHRGVKLFGSFWVGECGRDGPWEPWEQSLQLKKWPPTDRTFRIGLYSAFETGRIQETKWIDCPVNFRPLRYNTCCTCCTCYWICS